MTVIMTPPWPLGEQFPSPSAPEMERRYAAVRGMLRAAGAEVLIVAGHSAGRGELQYLTNVPVRWESLLVVPLEDEPRLLLQLDNHAAGATAWSRVPIEVTGPGLARAAAGMVDTVTTGASTPVAILGPVTDRTARALRAALGDREIVDLGPAFLQHRLIKSDEELTWTRWAASLCDAAFERFLDEAAPGMREDELGALLESAVSRLGGQVGICFMATASMTHGGAAVPNQTWCRRTTTADDVVMFELSAGFGGVTAQLLRTLTLGGEPTPIIRRLHQVADETFQTLLAALLPGVPARDLESIGGGIIERADLTIIDDMVHGYGGGYLPPVLRTAGTRRAPLPDLVLRPGMLLVVQPNVVTPDRRHGVQTGELLVITDTGAESMHAAPRGLLTVA